jgi:rhodanese-related sulfurtransferase
MDAGEKMVIVDVRPETFGDLIRSSVWVPYMKIGQWAVDHPRDELIVTYCACSHEATSGRAVRTLNQMGFTNAWALQGGLNEWRSAGYPMQAEPSRPDGDAG